MLGAWPRLWTAFRRTQRLRRECHRLRVPALLHSYCIPRDTGHFRGQQREQKERHGSCPEPGLQRPALHTGSDARRHTAPASPTCRTEFCGGFPSQHPPCPNARRPRINGFGVFRGHHSGYGSTSTARHGKVFLGESAPNQAVTPSLQRISPILYSPAPLPNHRPPAQ